LDHGRGRRAELDQPVDVKGGGVIVVASLGCS
jgi:hypothetical protein